MYLKINQLVRYFCWRYLIGIQLLIGSDDFESRNTISYQVKLPQSFKIDFEQSLRLRGNQFSFRQTFTEATISYKVTDGLKLILPLRYAIFEDKIKKRISFGGTYKYKFNYYTMRYKSRYQRVYEKDEDLEDFAGEQSGVATTLEYVGKGILDPLNILGFGAGTIVGRTVGKVALNRIISNAFKGNISKEISKDALKKTSSN